MSTGRNTTLRERHRRAIARGKPGCQWDQCLYPGTPIDYEADHLDPLAFTVDHRIPLAHGGTDTLDNKQALHRACNRAKSDTLPAGITIHRMYETPRSW